MARMAGKVAIVTGAAQGIGEATASIMAREGAKVVVADYNADGASAVAETIRGKGGDAHALFVDATKEESVRELIAKSRERYGFVNVMHNNVGGTEPVKDVAVADIDIADWDAIFNLTLKSTLFGCKYVIPLMLEHGGGAIVNTASMAGVHGGPGLSAYGGAKSAVIGLTRYVATQYGRHHIRCNAVAPGLIVTPRASELIPENVRQVFKSHNLVPRNGTPEDIGYTVTFLASDEAGFITGQVIQVDGGALTHGPTMVDLMKIGVMM
jgi:NAD(P)-dependent dehydrogenase (short-subunit alcohol dehydrogenase family)